LREHVQRSLRRTVVRVRRPRTNAAERADVHDASFAGAQLFRARLRHEKSGANIYIEHRVPLLRRDLFKADGFVRSGIVDEQIDPPQFGDRFTGAGLDRFHISQVAAYREGANARLCKCPCGLLGVVFRFEIRESDVCTGACERQCDFTADAARSAGDQSTLTCQGTIDIAAQRFSSTGRGTAGQSMELPCSNATVCSTRTVPS